jgi:hypothetical protein
VGTEGYLKELISLLRKGKGVGTREKNLTGSDESNNNNNNNNNYSRGNKVIGLLRNPEHLRQCNERREIRRIARPAIASRI